MKKITIELDTELFDKIEESFYFDLCMQLAIIIPTRDHLHDQLITKIYVYDHQETEAAMKTIEQWIEEQELLNAQSDEIYKKQEEIRSEIGKGLSDYIRQSGLISKISWNVFASNSIRLEAEYNDKNGKELKQLLSRADPDAFGGWHFTYELDDLVRINFDDNIVSMSFESAEDLKTFVSLYPITINFKAVVNEFYRLNKQMERVKEVLNINASTNISNDKLP